MTKQHQQHQFYGVLDSIKHLADCEDGVTPVSLRQVLAFATSYETIPLGGFDPPAQVSISLIDVMPTSRTSSAHLTLPGAIHSYEEFLHSIH